MVQLTSILLSSIALLGLAAADTCRSGANGAAVTFEPSSQTCFRGEGVGKPDTLCSKPQYACGNTCWSNTGSQICSGPYGNRQLVPASSRPSPPLDQCDGTTYNDANYHCWAGRVACLMPQQLGCGSACYAQFGQVGNPGYCCIGNGLVARSDPRCNGAQ